MIYDNVKNAWRYAQTGKIAAALGLADQFSGAAMPTGSYEVNEWLRAVINAYETRAGRGEPEFESHRVYADLQLVVEGEEKILVAQSGLTTKEYDDDADYELMRCEESTAVTLRAGDFVYLAPGEPHCPGIAVSDPAPVRKIVFKIKL